jgi:imidazolonepropionase-like amidohydrolase
MGTDPRVGEEDGVHVAFGTDLLFNGAGTDRENLMWMRSAKLYSNAEILKIATSGATARCSR